MIPLKVIQDGHKTRASGRAPAPNHWTWARLASAPHRTAFFAGGVALAVSALWWLGVLGARHAGMVWPWAVSPPLAHGLVMALAFNPLFMVGFLFTAGPKWLAMPEVPGPTLVRPVALYSAAWVGVLVGVHAHVLLAAAGLALAAGVWAALLLRFGRLVRASRIPDRLHARAVLAAGVVGAAAMAAAALGLALERADLVRAATAVALWGFVAPVFAIVSHRMLPFFTHSAVPAVKAWRPDALLWWMLAALGITGLVSAIELLAPPLPPLGQAALRATLLAVQAPTAVLLLWVALRWGLVQSVSVRLLAMLHGGFLWLGVAFALAATSQAMALWHIGPGGLGLAPMHALTVGFLGVTLLAMITRVAAGHSGRPLVADGPVLAMYAAVQLAAMGRVASALWPEAPAALLLSAAAAWALATGAWALRYGRWMGQPRSDGRRG